MPKFFDNDMMVLNPTGGGGIAVDNLPGQAAPGAVQDNQQKEQTGVNPEATQPAVASQPASSPSTQATATPDNNQSMATASSPFILEVILQ